MKEQDNKGELVIVSGPSGVGKSTICDEVIKRLENVYLSVSITSREKAETEIDSREYWFVSREDFQRRIEQGLLLEHAEVFGNLYGTPKDKIDEALSAGRTVILEIDIQGARQVKALCPDAAMVFILPPSQKELVDRMNGRGREDTETAEVRLGEADSEIAAAWQYYEYMVINDDFEDAVKEVIGIIEQLPEKNND
ncbi:MAG: guanylate kinase [Planctomycetota bacterium]|jgi:guanylate kinase